MRSERLKAAILPMSLLIVLEIWARSVDIHSDALAPPSAVVLALFQAFGDGSILAATRDTLASAFAGLVVGGAIGLFLGIALGIFQPLDRLMEVTIESLRPIPSIALLPIALIALGFGYRMEIVIVAFACVWPILILSRAAVRSIEPRLIEVSRALRLSPGDRVRKIIIPAALPRIFLAFRLAAGIALIVAGGAAWQAATYHPVSPPAPNSVPVTAPPRAAPASPPAVSAAAPLGVTDAGVAPAEGPSVTTAAPAAPQKAPPRPAALSEAELLEQARSAMKSDPARALLRANEHRQHFPRGALVQEREVIAIKALRALGRVGEADVRAEAFGKAFPGSAFERKLKPSP